MIPFGRQYAKTSGKLYRRLYVPRSGKPSSLLRRVSGFLLIYLVVVALALLSLPWVPRTPPGWILFVVHDAGQAIGRNGDGGIDGIIKEDRLGLDVIHIQAKCWNRRLAGQRSRSSPAPSKGTARKGVFITTSSFSRDAYEYVERIDSKIVLIDGAMLSKFMVDSGVGVPLVTSYDVKRVDSDYFSEE